MVHIYAPEQHDLYDGHLVISANRIYMGALNDSERWDHLDNEAKNVRPVGGTAEIDVDEATDPLLVVSQPSSSANVTSPPGSERSVIMRVSTYRFVVIGSMLSSFMVGLHVPALHDVIEHGATPRWEVLTATFLLVVVTVAGAWRLLRTAGPMR